jgi:hypothetical protein
MRSYQLKVANSCTEDWDQMKSTSSGKHCISCNKTVHDFTAMSNNDIIEFFQKNNESCGRFYKDQLNKPIAFNGPFSYKKKHWPSVAAFLIAGLFSAIPSYAVDNSDILNKTEIVEHKTPTEGHPFIDSTLTIKGFVFESDGKTPVLYGSVICGKYGCNTDTSGFFSFTIPIHQITEDSIEIKVMSVGYEIKTVNVAVKDLENHIILNLTVREIVMGISIITIIPPKVDHSYQTEYYKHELFGSNWYSGGW